MQKSKIWTCNLIFLELRLFKNILSSIPFINNYFSGIATIFMLHRVDTIDSNRLFPNENMKVSPEFLDSFIVELKSKGYEFISLDRLYEILQNKEADEFSSKLIFSKKSVLKRVVNKVKRLIK